MILNWKDKFSLSEFETCVLSTPPLRVGIVEYSTALDMTVFGKDENSYPVMSSVLGAVNSLGSKLSTNTTEYTKYQVMCNHC